LWRFIGLILFSMLPVSVAAADESTVLRVALLDAVPIVFADADGQAVGFGVDVLDRALAGSGFSVSFISCTREESFEMLRAGALDIAFPMTRTLERSEEFSFSDTILISTWGEVYTNVGSSIQSILDLDGLTLSCVKGSFFAAELLRLASEFGIQIYTLDCTTYDAAYRAVKEGRAAGAIGPSTGQKYAAEVADLVSTSVVFAPAPGRFMVRQNLDPAILDAIDSWIESGRINPDSEYNELRERWFSTETVEFLPRWVRIMLVLFVGGLLLTLSFIALLRRQVRLRTRELTTTNRALKAEITQRLSMQHELERNQTMLAESEARFRVMAESAPVGISIVERGVFQFVNDEAARIFGIDRATALAADTGACAALLASFGHTEEYGATHEIAYTSADGENRWISHLSRRLSGGDGSATLQIWIDMTAARAAAEALRERDTLLRAIYDNVTFAIFVKDLEGRYLLVNRHHEEVVGYRNADVLGKRDADLYSEDMVEHFLRGDRAAMETGRFVGEEYVDLPDGRHHYLVVKFPLRDEKGAPSGICGVATDISDRRRAEEALKHSEQTLRTIIDLVPHAIFALDSKGRFQFANECCMSLLNATHESLPGATPTALLGSRERAALFYHENLEILDGATGYVSEHSYLDEAGKSRVYQTHKTRFHAYGGTEWSVLGVSVEITELKRIQNELRRHQEDLEQRVRERTTELESAQEELARKERLALVGQMTATVSHELRNPLATIRGSVYLLDRQVRPGHPESVPVLDRLVRNIERCDRIIEELLDITRVKELRRECLHLDTWLRSLVDDGLTPTGATLELKLDSDVTVSLDRDRIYRCVLNLITNASQALSESATPHPLIRLETRVEGNQVVIEVNDNGPGILKEHVPKLFEPLFSTKSYGVGLGLPLARQIVELHGGRLEVLDLEQGVTARIYLPLML